MFSLPEQTYFPLCLRKMFRVIIHHVTMSYYVQYQQGEISGIKSSIKAGHQIASLAPKPDFIRYPA